MLKSANSDCAVLVPVFFVSFFMFVFLLFFVPGHPATGLEQGVHSRQAMGAKSFWGRKPEQLIAVAFQELAGRADKIGQLNISPDLLRELMQKKQ